MKPNFTRETVARWMRHELAVSANDYGGAHDVNLTKLAEAAADAFDVKDQPGPLDDETHWIWEVAVEAAES